MEIFSKVDAILIKNATMPFIDENFFYFTGLEGMEESIAVIMEDGVEIIAPLLEKREGIKTYKSIKERDAILEKLLKNKRVGINGKAITLKDYMHFKKLFGNLIDVSNFLEMKRAIKTESEIRRISKAVRITKDVVKSLDFSGKKETDVAGDIRCMFGRKGAEEAFKTIVAFGKNSSNPHHVPSNKKFVYPVLIDAGARYNGYCADITITEMKKKSRKYEIIEEALYMAIDLIEPGEKAGNVFIQVESFLSKHGIKMIHALGHSIGVKVHDGMTINKKANFTFKDNMVFAIEPAGYFKKFGIRIEEDIVIKNGKARIIK